MNDEPARCVAAKTLQDERLAVEHVRTDISESQEFLKIFENEFLEVT